MEEGLGKMSWVGWVPREVIEPHAEATPSGSVRGVLLWFDLAAKEQPPVPLPEPEPPVPMPVPPEPDPRPPVPIPPTHLPAVRAALNRRACGEAGTHRAACRDSGVRRRHGEYV